MVTQARNDHNQLTQSCCVARDGLGARRHGAGAKAKSARGLKPSKNTLVEVGSVGKHRQGHTGEDREAWEHEVKADGRSGLQVGWTCRRGQQQTTTTGITDKRKQMRRAREETLLHVERGAEEGARRDSG
jgi:hypothetical protein